jgi:hypothetical protein
VSETSEPRSVRLTAEHLAQVAAIQARLAVRPTAHQVLVQAVELGLAELERRLASQGAQVSPAPAVLDQPLHAEEDDAA